MSSWTFQVPIGLEVVILTLIAVFLDKVLNWAVARVNAEVASRMVRKGTPALVGVSSLPVIGDSVSQYKPVVAFAVVVKMIILISFLYGESGLEGTRVQGMPAGPSVVARLEARPFVPRTCSCCQEPADTSPAVRLARRASPIYDEARVQATTKCLTRKGNVSELRTPFVFFAGGDSNIGCVGVNSDGEGRVEWRLTDLGRGQWDAPSRTATVTWDWEKNITLELNVLYRISVRSVCGGAQKVCQCPDWTFSLPKSAMQKNGSLLIESNERRYHVESEAGKALQGLSIVNVLASLNIALNRGKLDAVLAENLEDTADVRSPVKLPTIASAINRTQGIILLVIIIFIPCIVFSLVLRGLVSGPPLVAPHDVSWVSHLMDDHANARGSCANPSKPAYVGITNSKTLGDVQHLGPVGDTDTVVPLDTSRKLM